MKYTMIVGYVCVFFLALIVLILFIVGETTSDGPVESLIVTEEPADIIEDLSDTYGYEEVDRVIPVATYFDIKENKDTEVCEEYYYEPDIEEVNVLARTLYGECRGIASDMEKAAVIWCILNRVDAGIGDTVIEVATAPNQFQGYNVDNPLLDNLVDLSKDVLTRWNLEHEGHTDVGRVLPSDYLYFVGDGRHNWFSKEYLGTDYWDWSCEDPYIYEEN